MILDIKESLYVGMGNGDGLEVDGGGLSGGGSFVIKIEGKRKVCCGEVEWWRWMIVVKRVCGGGG